MDEEEEVIEVEKIIIKGKEYLIDSNNVVYTNNLDDPEEVGVLIDGELQEYEEEEDEEGIFYLDNHLLPDLRNSNMNTGIRLTNSFMTEEAVRSDGFLKHPMFVEANGISFLAVTQVDRRDIYDVAFVGENNKISRRNITNLKNQQVIGIYNPEKNAFEALFSDYKRDYKILETYNKRIVNAFKDYILPKILFKKPEDLLTYTADKEKIKELKELQESIADLKKEITNNPESKILKRALEVLLKRLIPLENVVEDDKKRIEEIKTENNLIKQRNKELLKEQEAIKKQLKERKQELIRRNEEERKKMEIDDGLPKLPESLNVKGLYEFIEPDDDDDDDDDDDEKEGTGINNPELYEKAKQIADEKYKKPSAYKSGFIVKKYKELGGTYSGTKNDNKGIGRWFKEDWKDIGNKEYPVYRPTKRITKDTPLTPQQIKPSNLKKQIALKQEIKGDANLPPFQGKGLSLSDYSNPKVVYQKARKYLGKDVIIQPSTNKNKKYMVYDPNTENWVHFGTMKPPMEDFTKHQDEKRRQRYLARATKIKGDWKDNKYSANNLSINILW